MSRKPSDPNKAAVRVVRDSTKTPKQKRSATLEEAWAEWSKRIRRDGARTLKLLKGALAAGFDSANERSQKRLLGILGASEGGSARAYKLSDMRQ